jgi:glucosamine--fructose-6-phosphate aminotransferase (isomerizing)
MSVEQALHGPAIALREGMGAILISPAGDDGGRTRRLAQACAALGVVTLSCGSAGENLRFPSCDERVRPLVSAVPLQRLAAEVARIAGGDPDRTRLDTEPWKSALRR